MVKLKTIVLGTAMAASSFLVSCKDTDTENQATPAEKAKTEEQIREEQRRMYHSFVFDSVETVNGAKEIEKQLRSQRHRYDDENDIYKLRYQYSLGGTIEKKVLESGRQIVDKMYSDIAVELSKYGINLDQYITLEKHNGYSDSYRAKPGVVEYPSDYFIDEMVFIGVSGGVPDYAFNGLKDLIYTVIDKSERNDKTVMKNRTATRMEQGRSDLIRSRTSVEKQFKPFYLLYDEKSLGLSSAGEGEYLPGYEDLNYDYVNGKYRITELTIHVYDRNLDPGFFGDPDATYELVSVGDKKWRIIKTTKSGKVEKTDEFSDNREWEEKVYCSGEKPEIKSSFDFEPGDHMGVHVYVNKIVKIEQRDKDWHTVIPQDVQRQIDSLENQFNAKEALSELRWKKIREADSIAFLMAEKLYGPNKERQ